MKEIFSSFFSSANIIVRAALTTTKKAAAVILSNVHGRLTAYFNLNYCLLNYQMFRASM